MTSATVPASKISFNNLQNLTPRGPNNDHIFISSLQEGPFSSITIKSERILAKTKAILDWRNGNPRAVRADCVISPKHRRNYFDRPGSDPISKQKQIEEMSSLALAFQVLGRRRSMNWSIIKILGEVTLAIPISWSLPMHFCPRDFGVDQFLFSAYLLGDGDQLFWNGVRTASEWQMLMHKKLPLRYD